MKCFTEATFKPHDYTGTKPEQIFVHLGNLWARSAWSSCLGVSGLGGKLIEKAPPPDSYPLSDFVRHACNPPLCMNVHSDNNSKVSYHMFWLSHTWASFSDVCLV